MGMLGYARVSTRDQSLALQLDALAAAGVTAAATWTDTASGARVVRPGLDALLAAAVPGDAVVVWRLDRLGRSLAHLAAMSADLAGRGITVRSLTDGVDTAGSTGRLLLGLLGTLAEYEREVLRERTVAGMAAARRRGVHVGRRPSVTPAQASEAKRMMDEGRPVREVARLFRTSPASLYRALGRTNSEVIQTFITDVRNELTQDKVVL